VFDPLWLPPHGDPGITVAARGPLLQSTITTPTRRQPLPAPDRFRLVVANEMGAHLRVRSTPDG